MTSQSGFYPPPINPTLTQYSPANFVNTDNIDYTANDARYLKKSGDISSGALTITNTTASTTSTTGALVVSGGIGCSGKLNIASATKITDTTSSTGYALGALVVSGGVGIAKSLSIGGDVNMGLIGASVLNHNYATLPTYLSTSIGYNISCINFSVSTFNNNATIYNIGSIPSLGVGTYMCNVYILLSTTFSIAQPFIELGISTTSTTFSSVASPLYINYRSFATHTNELPISQSLLFTQATTGTVYLNYRSTSLQSGVYTTSINGYSNWSFTRIA